jgi:hypothetical protein
MMVGFSGLKKLLQFGSPSFLLKQAQKCGRAKPVPDPPVSKLKNIHVILILLLLFEKNWVIFPFSNQLTITFQK